MKNNIEGMKQHPAGGSNNAAFGSHLMPTNEKKAVGGVKRMTSAIRHVNSPVKSKNKAPFA